MECFEVQRIHIFIAPCIFFVISLFIEVANRMYCNKDFFGAFPIQFVAYFSVDHTLVVPIGYHLCCEMFRCSEEMPLKWICVQIPAFKMKIVKILQIISN